MKRTKEVCEDRCTQHKQCNFYSYTNDNLCNLYTTCENEPTQDHESGTTYRRPCKYTWIKVLIFLMSIEILEQYSLFNAALLQFILFQHVAIIMMIATKINHLHFVKEQRNFIKEFVKVQKFCLHSFQTLVM